MQSPREILSDIWTSAGGEASALDALTLTGDEPLDVLEYRQQHRAFPQESTVDQFFDEAQWESYRALGEHIGAQLFRKIDPAKGWSPSVMTRP